MAIQGHPTKILVATDGSPGSRLAARTAVELSKMFGAELHLVHVFSVRESGDVLGESFEEAAVLREEDAQWARELLDGQVKQIAEAGGRVCEAHLRCGESDVEVVELGEEIGADLIVVGSRGLSPLRRPIGSVSSSIAAHAHCPVLVVRGEDLG